MPQPQITANMQSEKQVQDARILAIRAGKSLRAWAGEKLASAINPAKEDTMTPSGRKPRASKSTAPVTHGASIAATKKGKK